ncbi:outer membrane beta-barrel family protein [Desertivirga arenae]|uniref:outer membrane beta-barrel family protein n=1 Tax=Desertivirga arenae TaxID=2810309 RepID=UPI001A95BD8B|nr:outer membrane beta-barrel family protein [Pedobacter sp. SYSU D00823]
MKALLMAVFLTLFSCIIYAQTLSVRGTIGDTTSLIKLKNTSVSVLNAKDSTLVKFTRAAGDGSFTIGGLTGGKFILLATYPGYADYVEHFKLDSVSQSRDFGNINMLLKSNLLKDIVVKGTVAAIKIKGDTTEYNASSFKIAPNAKVEDLLKQLPGIQVDKDGKITAQGQTVNKVLVDGEEFFGDDPTLVTKNLRSDMIDKVQLYDKKSDQATFTGIDDGIKDKTINLKLKEDKKNGYFGKLDGGGLDGNYYAGQGMFNKFKGKKKFSAYGTVGNTGRTGLSWSDNNKYTGGNMEMTEDGGIIMYSNDRDDLDASNYRGSGIPEIQTGGVHFDNKWNKDKESINANYKSGYLSVDGTESNLSQNNLKESFINNTNNSIFSNSTFRQKLDATYQLRPDSTTNWKFSIDASMRNTKSNSFNTGSGLNFNDVLINNNRRTLDNDGDQQSLNASAFFSKRLKKPGRTFSVNFTQGLSKGNSTGNLLSTNVTFDSIGSKRDSSVIDQLKDNDNSMIRTNSNLTYTEPLTKKFSLIVNYGFGITSSSSVRKSFNSAGGKYNLLDSVYSNDFDLNQISHQGGAVFNYKEKKTNVSFGSRATSVNFHQKDLFRNTRYDRQFINWLPQASYQYKFSNYKSFRINYNGRTSQPSTDQLQPVRVNTDPLNITIGNQNLKPSFTNSFNFNYNTYKVLANQGFYIYGSYSFTMNPIVNSTFTDLSTNVNTYQSINLKNHDSRNYNTYMYFSRKIQKWELNVGGSLGTDGNVYYSISNESLNKATSSNYYGEFSVSQNKPKKYDFYISFNPAYSQNESSLQLNKNNNGWVYTSNGGFNLYLPGKFQIGSNANYEFREKTAAFNETFERLLLNASVTKKFTKAENLSLVVSGNDLLNQNNGFSRRVNNNFVTQHSYQTIKRYFLATLVWEFNKMGGGLKSSTSNTVK